VARPEVPVPQVTLVVDRFSWDSSPQKFATLRQNWQYTNAADQTFAHDTTLCNAFTDAIKTRFQTEFGTDFQHIDGYHKNRSSVTNPVFHESHTAPYHGTNAFVSMPADTAILVRQPALSGGKRGNGRSYICGLGTGYLMNGQQTSAANAEAVADLWGFVGDDVQAAMTAAGVLGRLVLVHLVLGKGNLNPGVTDPFTQPMTDNFVGVQTLATQDRRSLSHRGRRKH